MINAEIFMGNAVSQSIHFFPWDAWMSVFNRFWEILAGFANNFKVSDDGVYGFVISGKLQVI